MALRRHAESVRKALDAQRSAGEHVAERIRKAQAEGWTIYALARELGESEQSLRARLKRHAEATS